MYPCIYYDTGKGFSDDEEVRLDYQNRPLNEFQTYEATLPTLMPILHLRMDPLQLPGVVALRNLTIGRYRVVKVDWPTIFSLQASIATEWRFHSKDKLS